LENFYQGDPSVLPFGSIKLTLQKFYRINGGSTQMKGVTPDIQLPDLYQLMDVGERRDSNSLAWDQIAKADFKPLKQNVDFASLIDASKKRIESNESFKLISQNAIKIKKQSDDNTYSLNQTKFQEQMKEAKEFSKKMENVEKSKKTLAFENIPSDLPTIKKDSTSIKLNDEWLKALKKDPYIAEANNVLLDWNNKLKASGAVGNSNKN
jgi:carboxyl-terminal processing protease